MKQLQIVEPNETDGCVYLRVIHHRIHLQISTAHEIGLAYDASTNQLMEKKTTSRSILLLFTCILSLWVCFSYYYKYILPLCLSCDLGELEWPYFCVYLH